MVKLFVALVIFMIFLIIVGIRNISEGAKHSWKKAKKLAEQDESNKKIDPEMDEAHEHLDFFIEIQEHSLAPRTGVVEFHNNEERLRYFFFIVGSIKRLSHEIKSKENSERWLGNNAIAKAVHLFGPDDAMKHFQGYIDNSNPYLDSISERGWKAMEVYMLARIDKATKEEFIQASTELHMVVRDLDKYIDNEN